MKRYFILYHNVFSPNDWQRFGCDFFVERDYDVVPVECLKLLDPEAANRYDEAGLKGLSRAVNLHDREDFQALLKTVSPDDFVLLTIGLSPSTAWLFALLAKERVRYAVLSIGSVPGRGPWIFGLPRIGDRVRLLTADLRAQLPRWVRRLADLVRPRSGKLFAYGPTFWIRAGTQPGPLSERWPRLWRARPIWTPSFDAASFHADKTIGRPADLPARYAVFLDDAFTGQRDYLYFDMQPFAPTYWDEMANFFSAVTEQTGLPVLVAQHPRGDDIPHTDVIAYKGRTLSLVRHAEVVIAHCSTAISWAVLARRPLLFVTTPDLARSDFGMYIRRFAAWFDQVPRDVTRHHAIGVLNVDEKNYVRYERAFVCRHRGKGIWEAVIDELMRDDRADTLSQSPTANR